MSEIGTVTVHVKLYVSNAKGIGGLTPAQRQKVRALVNQALVAATDGSTGICVLGGGRCRDAQNLTFRVDVEALEADLQEDE